MAEYEHPYGHDIRMGYQGPKDTENAIDITLRAPCSLVEIALFDKGTSTNKALKTHARISIPQAPLKGISYGDGHIFQIARDRFFLDSEREGLAALLHKEILPEEASIIDQSHGRVAIDLKGPTIKTLLSKLYAIDFSEKSFGINTGLATASHGVHTLIWRYDDDAFTLYIFRSYARSFLEILQGAALEFGYTIILET